MDRDIQKLYKSIVDNYFGPILVLDRTGRIFFTNQNMQFVQPTESILNRNMADLVERGIYGKSPSMQAIKSKKQEIDYLSRRGGSNIITTAVPILDDDGEVDYVIAYSLGEEVTYGLVKRIEDEKNSALRLVDYLSHKDMGKVNLVCADARMRRLVAYLRKVAASESTILLTGESGTGKDVFAQYIHANSNRSDKVYIPINCAAIPSELLESEFFGYSGGTFTGAKTEGKVGLFELADGGTLFLDEIAELPLSLQSKLLRVLDSGEVKKLGSDTIRKTNVRVLAATNRNIAEMVEKGLFREDLFYRINVIPIVIPPIRERKDDIVAIANAFLAELNQRYSTRKFFAPETLKDMRKYDWPGNVREIRNVVERIYITSQSNLLYLASTLDRLPKYAEEELPYVPPEQEDFTGMPLKKALKKFEEELILNTMQACNDNISKAAQRLGIARTSLYKKLGEIRKNELGKMRFTFPDPPADGAAFGESGA